MNDCILWDGALNSGGYPVTWFEGKTVYKHRLIANAKDKEIVMHSCDNRACINPDHLSIGTHASNSQDMVDKNRQAKGEEAGNSKLKREEVLEIIAFQYSLTSREVAKLYNISKTNVLDIWNRRIWKHINE